MWLGQDKSLQPLFSLSTREHTWPSPVFRETPHPWYVWDSHLKYFGRMTYIQKKSLHHFLKDPVSTVGLLRGLQEWPQQTTLGAAPVAIHTHLTLVPSYFTVGYRDGDIQGRIFLLPFCSRLFPSPMHQQPLICFLSLRENIIYMSSFRIWNLASFMQSWCVWDSFVLLGLYIILSVLFLSSVLLSGCTSFVFPFPSWGSVVWFTVWGQYEENCRIRRHQQPSFID